MILSAREIRNRLDKGDGLVIAPYSDACQQPASYDLRAAETATLVRGRCTLVHTLERVEMPGDIAAVLRCRSSYARRGVLLGGGFVDPGFRGQLTLCLTNMGEGDILLPQGDRVVQMILHEVKGVGGLYNGRYQDSTGVVGAR
ncbi:MAG: dCTP deaminase [Methanomicrobiales archaeon]|nr:dCTP deaminase [Methanomicrobiales archaeon]